MALSSQPGSTEKAIRKLDIAHVGMPQNTPITESLRVDVDRLYVGYRLSPAFQAPAMGHQGQTDNSLPREPSCQLGINAR